APRSSSTTRRATRSSCSNRADRLAHSLDLAVASVGERVEPEGHETDGDDDEGGGAVGAETAERAVEPDCVLRVVVARRLQDEDPDEAEGDRAGEQAAHADHGEPPADARTHLAGLRVVE